MNITSTTPIAAPHASANARAADGDYKTKGIGHEVRDADGDYKQAKAAPSVQAAATSGAAASTNGVRSALLGLPLGGA